jgi:membrane fusion protein, multidrug efflux system
MKKLLVIAVIIGCGALYHYQQTPTVAPKKVLEPKALKVEAAKVEEVNLLNKIETLGSLGSIDSVDISPEIAGQIAKIYFKAGSSIKRGTWLISLDDSVYQSELASAKANLKLSQMNYKRTAELSKRRISSEQELDQVLADLHDKQNLVKVKQSLLEKMTLKAPFSGVLGSRQISVGQYVSVGQPLVKLVATNPLKVEYTVPERYLADLRVGQKIEVISDSFPDKRFSGKVDYISPVIDKETRSIAVEAIVDNQKQDLSAGLFVHVNHYLGQVAPVLLIPEESLMPSIKGQKVFIIEQGKAHEITIKTGAHRLAKVEVISGLKQNQQIVTRGQHKLKDGAKVSIINQG